MSNLSNFFNDDTGQRVIGELVYLPTTEKYNVPNNGFLRCDGSAVSKTTYANLHSVLGIYPDTFDTTKSFITRTLDTMNDLIYANNIFVGVTNMATTRAYAVTSTDGITWSNVILDTGAEEFNNDAITITAKRLSSSSTNFLIGGKNGELMSTLDFVTITTRSSGTTSTIRSVINGAGGSVQYVYAGDGGVLATSDNSNGSSWTLRTSGTSSTIRALLYAGNRYVYAGDGGVLATSTDGITWSTKSSGTTSTIHTLNYDNGLYIYAGDGGVMATSTDANTWTQISSSVLRSSAHFQHRVSPVS